MWFVGGNGLSGKSVGFGLEIISRAQGDVTVIDYWLSYFDLVVLLYLDDRFFSSCGWLKRVYSIVTSFKKLIR